MSISSEIKESFHNGSWITKLIYINLAVFVVVRLLDVFLTLGSFDFPFIQYLETPASFGTFVKQPWTVLTYMFLHYDFIHILFNLLGLYWFGKIFLIFFNEKQLLGTYILGGLFGAICFILAFNGLTFFANQQNSYLLGASASVLAIMVAAATDAPNFEITLMFIGKVRLKYLALVWVFLDLLSVTSFNAGGHIAHLGGILFGFIFAMSYNNGHDLTAPLNKFFDGVANIFKRNPKMKVVKNKTTQHMTDEEYNKMRHNEDERIDQILDKIKTYGYHNLSKEEKEFLFKQKK